MQNISQWMEILKIFSGVLTPIIAIITTYIAWQQWKANKTKTRLDLFEKRYTIYNSVLEYFREVMTNPENATENDKWNFLLDMEPANFLYNNEIAKFIEEVKNNTFEYDKNKQLIIKSHDVKLRNDLLEKNSKIFDWFKSELLKLEKRFNKHLRINF